MKKVLITVCAALAAWAASATLGTPTISSVTADAVTGVVTVNYTLGGDEKVIVTMSVTKGAETLERLNVAGDVGIAVTSGARKIAWRIADDIPGGTYDAAAMSINLKAWSLSTPPLFLAVRTDQPADVRYYASEAALPESIGSARWKESWLLMRKISANGITWRAGAPNDAANRISAATYTTYGGQTPRYVTNDHDFYIGVYEMTQGQFNWLVGANWSSCHQNAWPTTSKHYKDHLTDWKWHPSENMTFDIITNSCKRLANGSGLDMRLPTEEEWEFAARGPNGSNGNPTHFSTTMLGYEELKKFIVNYQCASDFYGGEKLYTHVMPPMPVGMKTPNGWGLHDMLGNVTECCIAKDGVSAVVRGGRVIMSNEEHHVGYQVPWPGQSNYVGFRVCCGIPK